jgi:hypothetical protein
MINSTRLGEDQETLIWSLAKEMAPPAGLELGESIAFTQ